MRPETRGSNGQHLSFGLRIVLPIFQYRHLADLPVLNVAETGSSTSRDNAGLERKLLGHFRREALTHVFQRRLTDRICFISCLQALFMPEDRRSPGNELSQVRQEMDQLKQEYEQQRLDYEQRLKKLDDQLKRMEISSTAPATTLASPATVASVPPNPSAGGSYLSPARTPPLIKLYSKPCRPARVRIRSTRTTESIQLALSEEEKKRVRERMEHVLQPIRRHLRLFPRRIRT